MIYFTGQALQELAQQPTKKPFNFRELFNPKPSNLINNQIKNKTR